MPTARQYFPAAMAPAPARSNLNDGPLAVLFAALTIFFGIGAALLPHFIPGRWGLMSGLLMGLSLDAALWFGIIKNDHRCFALKLAFVVVWISKLFPLGMCLTLPLSEDYLFPWGGFLFEDPLIANLGRSLTSICMAIIFLASRAVSPPNHNDISLKKMITRTSDRFELFLIVAGCIKLGYWLSLTALDNPLFYVIRILNSTIAFVPFFVGFTFFRFKKSTLFWIGILIFELGVSFLTGSRGAAFTPIMYFLFGFVLGLPDWRSLFRWSFVLVPVCLGLLVAGVFIGAVRDVVGRTDLAGALSGENMLQAMDETTVTANIDYTGGIAYKAFRRLSGWGSMVIPVMTPDPVPYRGFSDFPREIRASTTLGIFALTNPNWRGNFYFSNIYLNPYGFAVHVDKSGRKTSNVPMPIQVDGFTRGGWPAAIGYLFFAYSIIFVFERFLRRKCLPQKQPFFLIMLTFLAYIAANRYGMDPLVSALRQLVLEGTLCFFLYYAFDLCLKRMGKVEKAPTSF